MKTHWAQALAVGALLLNAVATGPAACLASDDVFGILSGQAVPMLKQSEPTRRAKPEAVPAAPSSPEHAAPQAAPKRLAKPSGSDISALYTGENSWAPRSVVPTNYAVLELLDEPEAINTPDPASRGDEGQPADGQSPVALKRPLQAVTVDARLGAEVVERRKNATEAEIDNFAESRFGEWTSPSWDVTCVAPRFYSRDVVWAAPAVFHRPLYFEQPNVERYGHHVSCGLGGDCLQSAICAAHFFATVPLLPCRVGSQPCMDHEYVLGCYRPGSCNPHQLVRPKCTLRGMALQGLYTTGVVFFVP